MFEGLSVEILARIQFAFTVSFHIIFPAFTIGLASYLVVLNGLWLRTGQQVYRDLFDHWKTIFAVAFGMGVVSGIVMSYQFGTNWSVFSDRAGPVIGPLMTYEVLVAFFLEAGFLGIMLFGRDRVGDGLHMLSTALVAAGTLLSAFWILSANSWMHTPAGFEQDADGRFLPVDWWQIVFNPSFPYRLVHMVLAAYLTTAFAVAGAAAWQMLRGRATTATHTMFSMGMWMAVLVTPLQIVAGHEHGINTLEHQPPKVMAMEGLYHSHENGAPLALVGIPDPEAKEI
ncbi:cytochrome ubiquinol oxidase subunit I, partial [Cribrihabitans sp. XS_ASV171]